MNVALIGAGCGAEETLTTQALLAIQEADLIIGAARILDALPPTAALRKKATRAEDILQLLRENDCEHACVVFSGDSGFYSGAKGLLLKLNANGISSTIYPGISCLQYFAAKLERSWEDWLLCSAHGKKCDPVRELMYGRPVFFLTGDYDGPVGLCKEIVHAGLGGLHAVVGENLSYKEERIIYGTVSELANHRFDPLCVLLVEPAPRSDYPLPGIPDEAFIRDKVPMTKQEVRVALQAKLEVRPTDVCWDVGAGTGSVSVELSLRTRQTWAIEESVKACELIRKNRIKFCAWNLQIVQGRAPEALRGLPNPDVVFIGGSNGDLIEILEFAFIANPAARICVSAITIETMYAAVKFFSEKKYETEIVQIAVNRAKCIGELHMLAAQNPVFLITGIRK